MTIISPCKKIIVSNSVCIAIKSNDWCCLLYLLKYLACTFYLFIFYAQWCLVRERNYFYKGETISELIFCNMPSYLQSNNKDKTTFF